jgi:hypothetical protein
MSIASAKSSKRKRQDSDIEWEESPREQDQDPDDDEALSPAEREDLEADVLADLRMYEGGDANPVSAHSEPTRGRPSKSQRIEYRPKQSMLGRTPQEVAQEGFKPKIPSRRCYMEYKSETEEYVYALLPTFPRPRFTTANILTHPCVKLELEKFQRGGRFYPKPTDALAVSQRAFWLIFRRKGKAP